MKPFALLINFCNKFDLQFQGMQRVSYDAENSRLRVHGIDYNKNIVSDVIMDYKNVYMYFIMFFFSQKCLFVQEIFCMYHFKMLKKNQNILSPQGKEYVWANGYCRVLPAGNFSKSCVPGKIHSIRTGTWISECWQTVLLGLQTNIALSVYFKNLLVYCYFFLILFKCICRE